MEDIELDKLVADVLDDMNPDPRVKDAMQVFMDELYKSGFLSRKKGLRENFDAFQAIIGPHGFNGLDTKLQWAVAEAIAASSRRRH